MITLTVTQLGGLATLAFTVAVIGAYCAGLAGYKIGRRDAFEDGPEWPSARRIPDSTGRHRSDQDDVRLPSSAWLDTIPLPGHQPPLSALTRTPRHALPPSRYARRTTDAIAQMTAETTAYITAMTRNHPR
jgi:hypothetical protein